jgi:hypothetical protein
MSTDKNKATRKDVRLKRVGIRLNKPDDVRRLLARGINQVLGDELSTDKLRAISYAAQTILKVFELISMEERLVKIEEAIRGLGNK